jgi:dTMP kinase
MSEQRNPFLVAITGADGAGKTTLCRSVVDALNQRGTLARRLDRFAIGRPEDCSVASLLAGDRDFLRAHTLRMPSPARLLFLLWCYAEPVIEQLRQPQAPPEILVMDSYWMKHVAAEILMGCDARAALAATELLPQADMVFDVRVAPRVALHRKTVAELVPYECGSTEHCSPAAFLQHQQALRDQLDRWSTRWNWLRVDGERPIDELTADVCIAIQQRWTHASVVPQDGSP